jgi:hypothetical protein
MNLARDLIVDPIVDPVPPTTERDKRLATWYTQGHSDGLGDRLLMFDNTSAPSWEILRFNPAIACVPEFEEALRERVEQLRSFRHPAFPIVRALKELGREDGLAVASTYATGVRLSDALNKPRGAAFVARLMRQLVPAISALQLHRPGIAHGALSADRIVITAEGRLMIREHMVGSALDHLGWSPEQLHVHFGILVRPDGEHGVTLDQRADVVQLGLVALSLLAGTRIGPDEYPGKVDEILAGIAAIGEQPLEIFEPLRRWIERALQIGTEPFASAQDADEALADVPDDAAQADHLPFEHAARRDLADPGAPGPRLISSRVVDADGDGPASATLPVASRAEEREPAHSSARTPRHSRVSWRAMTGAAIGIVALAAGNWLFLSRAVTIRTAIVAPPPSSLSIESPEPGAQVWVDDQFVGATPLQLKVDSRVRSIRVLPPPLGAPASQPIAAPPAARPNDRAENQPPPSGVTPGVSQKTGGLRVSAQVQIYVLDGDRVLGSSTDGPIVSTAGTHEFEFVNSAIGFRASRTVEIKPGQVTTLTINVPNGTLNINAAPWASVWVDGNALGETPIGNLSIAPGQHEIVFRHPQLGERREKTIVRADGPTRVTANLQR